MHDLEGNQLTPKVLTWRTHTSYVAQHVKRKKQKLLLSHILPKTFTTFLNQNSLQLCQS